MELKSELEEGEIGGVRDDARWRTRAFSETEAWLWG